MIEIPLSKTGKHAGKYVTVISDEDRELTEFSWLVGICKSNSMYALTRRSKKAIPLHRVIMERVLGRPLERKEEVDHIDGNGLNNTRANLRLATHQQNMANRVKSINNKSGYKGVRMKRGMRRWVASISINGKNVHLGYFDTPEEAHQAYCAKAQELHGEFANDGNRPLSGIAPIEAPDRTIGKWTGRFRGVSFLKRWNIYIASITHNGQEVFLGVAKTEDEASQFRLVAEQAIADGTFEEKYIK